MTESPALNQLIAETGEILSPPLIYARLNDAVNHPRTSINDIAQIISEDAGLTARILKLANSPLYGRSNVDTISRACTLIGTREVRDLSLAVSIIQSAKLPEGFSLMNHWRHSVGCGIIARNIATFLREPSIERYFIAGILHDIGLLVLFGKRSEQARAIKQAADRQLRPLYHVELEKLGFDHGRLGGELLAHWGLPANITSLVTYHHQPSLAEGFQRDTTIIHLADIICQALVFGESSEFYISPLDEQAYDRLDLPLSEIENIFNQSDRQLQEILPIMMAAA
ncbi:MAG: HDOD domain-containing protein [Desulfuromonadaceae bacterium]|nr:HDOD domain-containing protein [Desulfuromonadaceae bacterium]